MERLVHLGGFDSVAVQWINGVLLLCLFSLAGRHTGNRAAFLAWLGSRLAILAGVSTVLLWFYLVPAFAPGGAASLAPYEPLALFAYLLAKVLYWALLFAGACHVARRRAPRVFVAAFAYCGFWMLAVPRLEGTMTAQALVAVPALVLGQHVLGGQPKEQRSLGTLLVRTAFLLTAAVWIVYLIGFTGQLFGHDLLGGRSLSAFGIANAYLDTLLDSAVTLSTLVVLIDREHLDAKAAAQRRADRFAAQHAVVVELARSPELAAGDFEGAAHRATELAAGALDVERVAVWLFDGDRTELVCRDQYTRTTRTHERGGVLRAAAYPAYFRALESGRYVDAHDARRDTRTLELAEDYLSWTGASSLLAAPIRVSGELVGVVSHEHVGAPRRWHADEAAFAGVVADQLGQAMTTRRILEAERKGTELEEQLRHSQRVGTVGQLAGGVAHDFNNLITAIMGYAGLALLDEGGRADHLRHIEAASQRATELARKLLDLGRRDAREPQWVAIDDVAASVLALVERVTPRDVEIERDLATEGWRVRADRGELEQVLLNLCLNARDAMPAGGRLHVSTGPSRPEELHELGGEAPDRFVAIRVRDTGTGIRPEDLERVFDPFFTTKPAGKGTGLGLAMCRGIVEEHGGEIRVDSEVGRGTEIEVLLPAVHLSAQDA